MISNVQLRKGPAKRSYPIYGPGKSHFSHFMSPHAPFNLFLPSCVWGDPLTPGCLALVPGEGREGRWEVVAREGRRSAVCKLLERGDGGCRAVYASDRPESLKPRELYILLNNIFLVK